MRRAPTSLQQLGRNGGIERVEIGAFSPTPKEFHGHVDRFVHGDDDAAARRAVELRDDETGDRHRRGECFRLLHGVLADRAVEHEQRFVRRVRATAS